MDERLFQPHVYNSLLELAAKTLGLSSDGTLVVVVKDGANVGIGTSTPNYALEVNGTIGLTGNSNRKLATASQWGYASSYRTIILGSTSTTYNVADGAVTLCFGVDISANANSSFTGDGRELVFRHLTKFVTPNAANDAYLNPLTFLSGSVGIGTDNPLYKLDVDGPRTSGGTTLRLNDFASSADSKHILLTRLSNSASIGVAGSQVNDPLWISRSTGYDLMLTSNGNIGVGTVAPTAKFEITGSSNSALMNVKSPISGAIFYISGSGAIGVGTQDVGTYRLQVSGSFAATTKSFVIDHPTKKGKKLIYGSLESPYHGIRLTGRSTIENGKGKVELPEYMHKLILHDSINIQVTGIKCNKTLYVDEINIPENYFVIAYDKGVFESYKDYDFFWDFTAIRADVPELDTEI